MLTLNFVMVVNNIFLFIQFIALRENYDLMTKCIRKKKHEA